MTARYAPEADIAWLEALDGGRPERTAWIANVRTSEVFTLDGAGWLVWVMLAEGASSADEIIAAGEEAGAENAFDEVDLPEFLEGLVQRGILRRIDVRVSE